MTELDRLKKRRETWCRMVVPYWMRRDRQRDLAALDAEIERLEKEQLTRGKAQPDRHA